MLTVTIVPKLLWAVALSLCCVQAGGAQVLELPPRSADAPGGAQLAREVRDLDLEAREERLFAEISRLSRTSEIRARVEARMAERFPVEFEGILATG